jgi:glycosyltransferase involved in cell wall biosynthesis
MKIAIIKKTLLGRGGGTKQMLNLAKKLLSRGHEVTVFVCEYDRKNAYPELCTDLNIVAVREKIYDDSDGIKSYKKILKRIKWKLGRILLLLFSFIDLKKIADIVAKSDFDIINPHENLGHWVAFCIKRKKKVPVVWTLNDLTLSNPYDWGIKRLLQKLLASVYSWMEQKFISSVDLAVVLDKRMKNMVSVYFRKTRVEIVRSGVDSINAKNKQFINLKEKYNLPAEARIILACGILFPHRRFEDVIRALEQIRAQVNSCILIIIGDNQQNYPYYEQLLNQINSAGMKNIVKMIPRSIPEQELIGFFKLCDIFVFPNENQTWGLAALEAMINGKPVIVSTGSGVAEVLHDHKNSLLFEPRDVHTLAKHLLALLTNTALYKEISVSGQKLVSENFTVDKYAERMENVFYKFTDPSNRREG